MSNIEIGFETVKNVIETNESEIVLETNEPELVIETNEPEIVIEITGLKSLTSFIGLTDTPIFYDNGKFFKVENNKIIYTDIQWSDIKGKIEDNPELVEQVASVVKEYSQGVIDKSIEQHNTNENSHLDIRNTVNKNFNTLNDKIDENVDTINSTIENIKTNVDINKNDITNLKDKHNTDIDNINTSISDINTEIIDINNDITDVITNISLLDNKVETNTKDIADLTQVVEDDFKEVNEHIANNTTNIANNTIEINAIKNNLDNYSKTSEFADVAFSGDYNDLLNQPNIPSIEGLATTKYVDDEIAKSLGDISEFDFLVVEQLPETGESNHIYLVPHEQTDNNIYDEYIWISGLNKFELIGTTDVDLSNYYNKTETDNLLNDKSNKNETGANLEYNNSILTLNTKDGTKLSEVTIKSAPEVDNKTIHFNSSKELEVLGNLTKNGTFKYDWIGTEEEYNQGITDGIITDTTMCLVIDDEENIYSTEGEMSTIIQRVTYDELVSLKHSNKLKEGVFYRITDYITTTNGASTNSNEPSRSAGHQFDIIIQALGVSDLSDIASCALHEGDTYFSGQNIGSWQIWYDINNNINKYYWADTENGKGVIYRMIDEKFNDLPYDFKNIQFFRDKTLGQYNALSEMLKAVDGYYYTFSYVNNNSISDFSLQIKDNTKNIIGLTKTNSKNSAQNLNNIVFLSNSNNAIINDNNIGTEFYNNTIKANCYSNTISLLCYDNIFSAGFYYNNISNGCYKNLVNGSITNNQIGAFFRNTTIKGNFQYNTIGNYFNNTINADFKGNTTDIYCTGNIFNGNFTYNKTGAYFQNNKFNGAAQYNEIGKLFRANTVGKAFNNNNIQQWVTDNNIGANFQYNTVYANNYYINFPDYFILYTLDYGLIGAGANNKLDFTGLPVKNGYPVRVFKDANNRIVATWSVDNKNIGLYKTSVTSNNWLDLPVEDLSNYYTKEEVDNIINNYATKESLLEKSTEIWTFTLEDGTEVTKTIVLGA